MFSVRWTELTSVSVWLKQPLLWNCVPNTCGFTRSLHMYVLCMFITYVCVTILYSLDVTDFRAFLCVCANDS